jgi:hypothetical protein
VGFLKLEKVPSPNFQENRIGLPWDWSVNLTTSGAVPFVGLAVNSANGVFVTVIYACFVRVDVDCPDDVSLTWRETS